MAKKQAQLAENIENIKAALNALGRFRPGSLSKQRRARGNGYFQLTYAHQGKVRCQYVRPDYEPVIRRETQTYRRFRELTRRWVALELQLSRLKQQATAAQADSQPAATDPSRRTEPSTPSQITPPAKPHR